MTKELKWMLLCAALAAGEACGFAAPAFAGLWPLGIIATVCTMLFGFGCAWRLWPYAVAFVLGLTLALGVTAHRQRILDEALEVNAGRPLTLVLTVGDDVREEMSSSGVRRYTFVGDSGGLRVRVRLAAALCASVPQTGEVWELTGWIGRTGDGLFGRRLPFWIGGRGTSARRLHAAAEGFSATLRAARREGSRRVGIGLDHAPLAADLNRAMLLGERRLIPENLRADFIAAGTVHVFAISGLHVLFIARLLAWLLSVGVGVPGRFLGLALIPLIWLYVLLVGCGPSAVRAATMATFYYAAPLFWRRPNGFTAWSLAFLVTYGLCPALLLNVGCNFSFAVMLALVLWEWWLRPFPRTRPDYLGRLGVAIVAWLAGVPIAAHVFGRVTPGGLFANLAAVPLAGLSVSASALGVMVSGFSDWLAAHFNNFAALTTEAMATLSRLVAAHPWATRDVEPWPILTCILWYLAVAAFFLVLRVCLLRRRHRI